MIQSDVSTLSANVVEGFSTRFNVLLDRAGIPKQYRVSRGAERFHVAHNTFKGWCFDDRIPGTHSALVEHVEALLKDVPGRHNPKAVVAWLLAGDAVPDPFGTVDTDALPLVELYLQIRELAHREGVEFDKLPREVRNRILKHVLRHLRSGRGSNKADDSLQLDQSAVSMVIGMLDTASAAREPVHGS